MTRHPISNAEGAPASPAPALTDRDLDELRRAANIAYRVSVLTGRQTLRAVADVLMVELVELGSSLGDDRKPVEVRR